MDSYFASEAKIRLRDILNAAERGEPSEIKRYDTPTAIVVGVPWYQEQPAWSAWPSRRLPAAGSPPATC